MEKQDKLEIQQKLQREALFRHNDLSHPVMDVLLHLQLKHKQDE